MRFATVRAAIYATLAPVLPTLAPWRRVPGTDLMYQDENPRPPEVDARKALRKLRARPPHGSEWKVGQVVTLTEADGSSHEATIVSVTGDILEID